MFLPHRTFLGGLVDVRPATNHGPHRAKIHPIVAAQCPLKLVAAGEDQWRARGVSELANGETPAPGQASQSMGGRWGVVVASRAKSGSQPPAMQAAPLWWLGIWDVFCSRHTLAVAQSVAPLQPRPPVPDAVPDLWRARFA